MKLDEVMWEVEKKYQIIYEPKKKSKRKPVKEKDLIPKELDRYWGYYTNATG